MPYIGNVPSSFNVGTDNINNDAITTAKIADGAILNTDVNSAAAIAGTKISPDFGSQNILTTGTATAASLIPTSSTVPTNGVYLPAANSVAISTNSSGRLFINSSGDVRIGSAPDAWSNFRALQVGGSTSIWSSLSGAASSFYSNNIYFNGTNRIYTNTGFATEYIQDQSAGDHIFFTASSGTAGGVVSFSERMRLTNAGRLGIGTSTPGAKLSVQGGQSGISNPANGTIDVIDETAAALGVGGQIVFRGQFQSGAYTQYGAITAYKESATVDGSQYGASLIFNTRTQGGNNTEKMRLDSSGRLGIGSTAPNEAVTIATSSAASYIQICDSSTGSTSGDGFFIGSFNGAVEIKTKENNILQFGTNNTERMRILSGGGILFAKTTEGLSNSGTEIQGGLLRLTRSAATLGEFNRLTDDGELVGFWQDNVREGSINVSGTTVSYNGAHLSRWSQIEGVDSHDKAARPEILRGTIMSNLDEMCDWTSPGTGDCQDNEQLNKTKISDVDDDPNVAGVFQSWDDDDDTWVNDYYLAMTGDFVIRVASGTTVQRGDLLVSAGDGTARPQGDRYLKDSTIAKVTSTTVSCTHPDGSYCVPCVLMAC